MHVSRLHNSLCRHLRVQNLWEYIVVQESNEFVSGSYCFNIVGDERKDF